MPLLVRLGRYLVLLALLAAQAGGPFSRSFALAFTPSAPGTVTIAVESASKSSDLLGWRGRSEASAA
jgi:hypothetical protein